jgi:hypothetical protein
VEPGFSEQSYLSGNTVKTPLVPCDSKSICDLISHAHTKIELNTGAIAGNVTIFTRDSNPLQQSNSKYFSHKSPQIFEHMYPPKTNNNTLFFTDGRPQLLKIFGRYLGDDPNYFSATVGGNVAPLEPGTLLKYGDGNGEYGEAIIRIPEGAGKDVKIIVNRGIGLFKQPSLPSYISYRKPEVHTIKDSSGSIIVPCPANQACGISTAGDELTIEGANFGPTGSVIVQDWTQFCKVLLYDHAQIKCQLSPGEGRHLRIYVTSANQQSSELAVSFSPPEIDLLSPTVAGTPGNESMFIYGRNFGTLNPSLGFFGPELRVGAKLLVIESFTSTKIQFLSIEGEGIGKRIDVQVGNQQAIGKTAIFSYKPPVLNFLSPSPVPTSGMHNGSRVIGVLQGANFGSVNATVSISLNGNPLQQSEIFRVGHNRFKIFIPEGQCPISGGVLTCPSIAMDVNGQKSMSKISMMYKAPRVSRIHPLHGPTDGCLRYEDKVQWILRRQTASPFQLARNPQLFARKCMQRAVLTIFGDNFGVRDSSAKVGENFELRTDCESCSHGHTQLVVTSPVGYGTNLSIKMDIGGRVSNGTEGLQFHFDPPQVANVVPGAAFLGSGYYDARGDQEIKITGKNFGSSPSNISIMINGKQCRSPKWNFEDIDGFPFLSCTPGEDTVGPKNATVHVAGQTIEVNNLVKGSKFAMFNSKCKTRRDERGNIFSFYGQPGEFCAPCPVGAFCRDESYELPLALPGFWMAQLDISDPASEDYARASGKDKPEDSESGRCPPQRYDSANYPLVRDYCPDVLPCQPAGACNGSNICSDGYTWATERCRAKIDPSYCKSDWILRFGSEEKGGAPWPTSSECGSHWSLRDDNLCTTDSDCDPDLETACSASNPETCSRCELTAHANGTLIGHCVCTHPVRCALCTVGTHYRINNKCDKCPDNPELLFIGFGVAVVFAVIGGYILNRKKFNLAFLSIGVDYFQVLAIFGSTDINWPDEILQFFRWMRFFNVNIDVTAPECLMPNLEYETKWWGTMMLPFGILLLLTMMMFIKMVMRKLARRRNRNALHPLVYMVSNFLLLFYYMYLSLTRRALDVFNCNPTSPDDGYLYTEFTSIKCAGRGGLCRCGEGIHSRLVTPAGLFFAIYSIGFPLYVLYILKKYKALIKEDQLLRALELGDHIDTSRKEVLQIRNQYHKIYYHFKPGKTYWIEYIIFRKFMIAFAGLMFRGNPGFQLAIILLVLFACYVLQVKHHPYMSSMERDHVVHQFKVKAEEGKSEWHRVINRRITAQAKKRERINTKIEKSKFRSRAKSQSSKSGNDNFDVKSLVHETHFWDYNTVEALLLACAVLVCLAGIMFESDRFENRSDIIWQRDIITVGVFMVIIFSVVYYGLVFFSEVGRCNPTFLKVFMTSRNRFHHKKLKEDNDGDVEMGSVPTHTMQANPLLQQGANPHFINPLVNRTNIGGKKKQERSAHALSISEPSLEAGRDWKAMISEDKATKGQTYYHNQITGEVTWTRPKGFKRTQNRDRGASEAL